MKILHISSTDLIGGRFNGYYMQRAVNPGDHQFEMSVWDKHSDNPAVHILKPHHRRWLSLLIRMSTKIDNKLGLEGLTGLGSYLLSIKPYFRSADIVHLQIIHNDGYFNILDLPRLSHKKPMVWTIHDFWALSGMCIYPFECGGLYDKCIKYCPYPRGVSPLRHYIPALHHQFKRYAYHFSNINLVVASRWLLDKVQRSPLLRHLPATHIPFGIDIEQFRQHNKEEAKHKLGIPLGNRVIAMRAASEKFGYYSYLYKGIEWLRAAVELYQPKVPTTLLIFQDPREFQHLQDKYQIINLPWVDGDNLVDALSTVDVFMMPSIQETFGVMAIEAMACNIPVVVFDGTSLPEVIQSPRGGIVVPTKDSIALASTIEFLLDNEEVRFQIGNSARALVEEQYNLSMYVNRHITLYQSILENAHKIKST